VRISRYRSRWLCLVSVGLFCLGPIVLTPATADGGSKGITTTIAGYFESLRQMDVEGVRATLAPDYSYDRSAVPAFDPANPFSSLLSVTYRSLSYRIEALTLRRNTAMAVVTTLFEGDLDLQVLGRWPVIGNGRFFLELEPRAGQWKLTAVRPVRVRYRNPQVPLPPAQAALIGSVPTLFDYTLNGRTALQVAPGAPLQFTGKSRFAFAVAGVIGDASLAQLKLDLLESRDNEPWELPLQAPETPGRYLAYALSIIVLPDPVTGQPAFVTGDQVTVPVTVLSPR
jgi:hypothetical protein